MQTYFLEHTKINAEKEEPSPPPHTTHESKIEVNLELGPKTQTAALLDDAEKHFPGLAAS